MKPFLAVFLISLLSISLGCASPEPHPELPEPGSVVAAEATFGDSLCRRLESADDLLALATFLASKDDGWQSFWGDPIEPQVSVVLFDEQGARSSVGLADAQLLARVEGSPAFRDTSDAEANRFIDLLGGVPVGLPENPCRSVE